MGVGKNPMQPQVGYLAVGVFTTFSSTANSLPIDVAFFSILGVPMIEIKFKMIPVTVSRSAKGVKVIPQSRNETLIDSCFKVAQTADVAKAYVQTREQVKRNLPDRQAVELDVVFPRHNAFANYLVQSSARTAAIQGFDLVGNPTCVDFYTTDSVWEKADYVNKFGIPNLSVLRHLLAIGLPIYSHDLNCRVVTKRGRLMLQDRRSHHVVLTQLADSDLLQLFTNFTGQRHDNEIPTDTSSFSLE